MDKKSSRLKILVSAGLLFLFLPGVGEGGLVGRKGLKTLNNRFTETG